MKKRTTTNNGFPMYVRVCHRPSDPYFTLLHWPHVFLISDPDGSWKSLSLTHSWEFSPWLIFDFSPLWHIILLFLPCMSNRIKVALPTFGSWLHVLLSFKFWSASVEICVSFEVSLREGSTLCCLSTSPLQWCPPPAHTSFASGDWQTDGGV